MKSWRVWIRGLALAGLPVSLAAGATLALDVLASPDGSEPSHRASADTPRVSVRPTSADRQWWGIEFARRFGRAPKFETEFHCVAEGERSEGARMADELRVSEITSVLDRVNPVIRRLLHGHGARVVFVEGIITGIDETRNVRGVVRHGFYTDGDLSYDDVVGLYYTASKTSFVRSDRPISRARHTLLHELGHMLDDVMGDPATWGAFRRATERDDAIDDLGYPEHIADPETKQGEYFADSFAHLHESLESRAYMRRHRPAVSRWFDDFLRRRIEADYGRLERKLDRELARRVRERVKAAEGVPDVRTPPRKRSRRR